MTESSEKARQYQLLPGRYRNVFGTPEGRMVLDDLRQQFYDVDLLRNSAHHLHAAVGGHAAVRYILDMMETHHDERNTK